MHVPVIRPVHCKLSTTLPKVAKLVMRTHPRSGLHPHQRFLPSLRRHKPSRACPARGPGLAPAGAQGAGAARAWGRRSRARPGASPVPGSPGERAPRSSPAALARPRRAVPAPGARGERGRPSTLTRCSPGPDPERRRSPRARASTAPASGRADPASASAPRRLPAASRRGARCGPARASRGPSSRGDPCPLRFPFSAGQECKSWSPGPPAAASVTAPRRCGGRFRSGTFQASPPAEPGRAGSPSRPSSSAARRL